MNIFRRPLQGRVLAGVCAGVADRFGVQPLTVRLLFLVSCLLPGPQFIAYLVMWILVPSEKRGVVVVSSPVEPSRSLVSSPPTTVAR